MKYKLTNFSNPNSMRLQSIGIVEGRKSSDIKVGDTLMWNFGYKSKVINIIKETQKTLTIQEQTDTGIYERKLFKDRLVCILE